MTQEHHRWRFEWATVAVDGNGGRQQRPATGAGIRIVSQKVGTRERRERLG